MLLSIWRCAFIFLFLISGCQRNRTRHTQSSCTILQALPEKDLKTLDSFFQILCREYDFAYTLFGNKPMSMACYSSSLGSTAIYHPAEYLNLEKGWELWENYKTLFPSKQFVFKKCTDNISAIFLLNKQLVLDHILQNQKKFEEILKRKIEPQEFLQQLCHSEHGIMELLAESSELLGILLGYGKTNAMLFERRAKICMHLNAQMMPPFSSGCEIENLQPSSLNFVKLYRNTKPPKDLSISSSASKYNSLAEELNDITSHSEFFELYGSDFYLDQFIAPVFMMRRENPENQDLMRSYLATKLHLRQIYKEGPFLEITLNQWMCPQ